MGFPLRPLLLLSSLLSFVGAHRLRASASGWPRGRGLGHHYWPDRYARPFWVPYEVHDNLLDAYSWPRHGHQQNKWDGQGVARVYAPEHTFGVHGQHTPTSQWFGPNGKLYAQGWNVPVASPYYFTPPSLTGDWWAVPNPGAGKTWSERYNFQNPKAAAGGGGS